MTSVFIAAIAVASTTAPAQDTVLAQLVWTVGEIAGDEAQTFGRLTSVAMDRAGRVFVTDAQGSLLKAYGPSSQYLGVMGSEGDGPGEYVAPTAVTVSSTDLLFVRDSRRITLLSVGPGGSEVAVQATWPGPLYPSSSRPSQFDNAGRYYYPYSRSLQRSGAPPEHLYLVYSNGEVIDTVPVPALETLRATDPAWVRTGPGGGRILPGLNHVPFAPTPSWDVLPDGTVVSSDGASHRLLLTDREGALVSEIQIGPDEQRPIPRTERADSLRALEARLEEVPVPLDDVIGLPRAVRDMELPAALPRVLSVRADIEGRIWVQRWPDAGRPSETDFDVYSRDGRRLGTVRVPAVPDPDVAPWIGRDTILLVTRDPAFDIHRLVRFAYTL